MRKVLAVLSMALLVASAAVGAESSLEEIALSSALAEIKASRGVVFVDLYADW